jgi:glycosyltransferase involved in cell wall biosynthesis
MPKGGPKVVAVIMTYNCAHLLPKAYAKIPMDLIDDVIVTDDGSHDGSYEVAVKLGLTAFRHEQNQGYGGNLKAGFRHALECGADYIIEVHGDAQFDPGAIQYAFPYMQQAADLILGSRFQNTSQARQNGMPLVRFAANRFISFFDRLVLRLPLTEFHTGFRVYSRKMLQQLPWQENSNDYLFSFEIIAQAAYYLCKVVEVPVEADYHSDHTSISLRRSVMYALQTFRTLGQFLLARSGLKYNRIFQPL